MTNQIKLTVPAFVHVFREFNIIVQLVDATPHRWETIRIIQTAGPEPRLPDQIVQIAVQADGTGSAIIRVALTQVGVAQFCPEDPDGQYFGACESVKAIVGGPNA